MGTEQLAMESNRDDDGSGSAVTRQHSNEQRRHEEQQPTIESHKERSSLESLLKLKVVILVRMFGNAVFHLQTERTC